MLLVKLKGEPLYQGSLLGPGHVFQINSHVGADSYASEVLLLT